LPFGTVTDYGFRGSRGSGGSGGFRGYGPRVTGHGHGVSGSTDILWVALAMAKVYDCQRGQIVGVKVKCGKFILYF